MDKKICFPIVLIFGLMVTSCKSNKSLLDFTEYKDVDVENIVRIDVSWDSNKGYPIEFSISEDGIIRSIMDEFCESNAFYYVGNNSSSGGHSSLILVDSSDVQTGISLFQIKDGSKYYGYSSQNIKNIVHDYGLENGFLEK